MFVFLAPGRTGLIPLGETGVAKDADIARAFPLGAVVEVVVLEVDPSGRRIRLSAKAVLDAQEAAATRMLHRRRGSDRLPTSSAAQLDRAGSEVVDVSMRPASAWRGTSWGAHMDDRFTVTCPYCGEDSEIYIEPDVAGSFVQDCEVCCNPWRVRVSRDGSDRHVDVGRADGSE